MKKTFFIAIILIAACSKNSPQHAIVVPDLVQAANKRGNITGTIKLYDADGKSLADNSGVTISIDNSSVNTQTAADGKWTLDSIPFGTYDINYAKAGYGTGKLMGVNHEALNHATTLIAKHIPVNALSAIEIQSLRIANWNSNPTIASLINAGLAQNGVHIDPVFTNTTGKNKAVRFFFSDSPNVDATNYLVTDKQKFSGVPEQAINAGYELNWFTSNGFTPGQTVYIKAYGDGYVDDAYENPISGNYLFPSLALKGSNTVSFVVPLK